MSEARSMNLTDWKNVAIKSVKVTISTFGGVIAANAIGWTNLNGLKAAGIAAAAAGVNVIWNSIMAWATDTD